MFMYNNTFWESICVFPVLVSVIFAMKGGSLQHFANVQKRAEPKSVFK